MNHLTDKKEIEGTCKLKELLDAVKIGDMPPELAQGYKNFAVSMLWCITQ